MRKLVIAVLALAAVVAVVGVAVAANTYTVHVASTNTKGKGTAKKPIPTGLRLGFQVAETDPTKRATVIEKYSIGAEGLVTNTKAAPKCAFTDMDDEPTVPRKCNKALVGSGLVKNAAGPSTNQALSASSPCNLQLRLYNSGRGMIIRLDGGPPIPPGFESDEVGCALPIHTAINARFVKTRIAGVPASDLRFTVPQNLKHPLAGTDNSIRESVNNIKKITKTIRRRGKRVKIGYYNKVGCKGGRRTTRATFTTEATASQPTPQTFTATKQSKC
jgi:hypothetical protein